MELKLIKDRWIEEIKKLKDEDLCVKLIAGIIGVSKSRIYKDLYTGEFEGAEKKGPYSKSDWIFTHDCVTKYIQSFPDNSIIDNTPPSKSKIDLTPPSKRIPFPGWEYQRQL